MLQAITMYADLFIDKKKQFFCFYHISHIFDNTNDFKNLFKSLLDHCVLWSTGAPTFIRRRQQTEIRHNTIND